MVNIATITIIKGIRAMKWPSRKPLMVAFAALIIVSGVPLTAQRLNRHQDDTGVMHMTQAEMHMIEPATPDAFTPKAVALASTGWTATASDQEASYPAGNVLDGSATTIWHSKFSPTPTPLPHYITIDMQTARSITGLTYLPRQDTSSNGNIGQYTITTSSTGASWSSPVSIGDFADDKAKKTVSFAPVTVRYVRLTASTEAGDRGPWSTAAEVGLLGGPATDPALPRTGWTAQASDANAGYPAGNVLDGNAGTIWHTVFGTDPAPLPHSLTIDMKAPKTVTGLAYLPRQDTSPNGTIGKYAVATSTDGASWATATAGTWADDPTQKVATFAGTTARYVRLTASTEAGDRGPWSTAAEINVLSPGPAAGIGGKWGPTLGLPLVPVATVVLPNNKLLTFAAYSALNFDKANTTTKVSIIDLATSSVGGMQTINTAHEMFCTGLAIMADGRVLINGGSSDAATTIYDPVANTWTKGPFMTIPRAYESTTLLSTGKVFTLGGSWDNSAGGKNGEVYTPGGSWTGLPGVTASNILTADPGGVYRSDNHAWLFATSNGGVFHAGPSKQMNWITTSGSGSIVPAGRRGDSADAMNGNAVMYDINKILTLGGATAYQDAGSQTNTQATTRAYTLDISGGPGAPVAVNRVGDLTYARSFVNSVVLPDGQVLAFGGQQHPQGFTDTGAAMSPELWNPATGQFGVMAADIIPRTYHSVAVLLPDGRIFSGGGGLCGACTTNHTDGRIFTPPYLLNPDGSDRVRPGIASAPTTAASGSTITVSTGAAVSKFALVRTSAVTHGVNTDQRRIPLIPTATNSTTYTLPIPSDRGVALPGTYMLFALDANGTPSIAKFISIN